MKLEELKNKCSTLGIIPQPTRHRKNPDRLEVCADDCIRAIQQYNISLLKESMPQNCNNINKLLQIKSPMLALLIKHQSKDIQKEIWDNDNKDWVFEKKYDGIRCFIYYNSELNKFSVYGRALDNDTLLPKDYSDRFYFTEHVDLYLNISEVDFILDCEFIIDGYNHEILESILDDPYKDIEQFRYRFILFDMLHVSSDSLNVIYNNIPLWKRQLDLKYIINSFLINGLPFQLVESKPDTMTKEEYYNYLVNNGGEGVIAKNLNSAYDIEGKRNGDWTKIKRLKYEGTSNLNEDTYDLFVSDYIIDGNMISGLELSSYLIDDNGNYIYDRFNNQVPLTLGILYDLLPDTKKTLTLYDNEGKPYINPRFLDMVVEVKSSGFDESTNQLQNLKFVCWRLDKNSRDCKYKK